MIPFPTPFDESERVDAAGLRANIEKWNETGISGYVALGSTGERVHLDERECLEVIETARGSVPQSTAFIVGAGQQSTHATINEARRYAGAGADALLVITPNFYRAAMTQSALINHYLAVADASPVPLVLYSMPDLTGIALAPETVARLASHENIIGLKDSSGDLLNLAETLRLVPEDFAALTGNGGLLAAALGAGARGAILAVGCVAFEQCQAIYRALETNGHERAHELQRVLTPLARAVTVRYGIGGLKAALELRGYAGGHVRSPLQVASVEARREIARLLEDVLSEMPAETGSAGSDDYDLAGVTTK
jgi:4-hydroxy-2-oxoglutarate aldolase